MTPISLSRKQAVELTSLSKDEIDRAIRRGDLRAKKQGRRVVILAKDLERYLESLEDA